MRIIGAQGKRPILRNVSCDAVEHFRSTVEIVDLIGETSVPKILDATKNCASRNPGPVEPFAGTRSVATIAGYVPQRMISDPAGYFVVFPDRGRRLLTLEHYRNNGVLDIVFEGHTPAELYIPAIERNLISRLDHAAYLGKELARAEQAMLNGGSYIQDAAPELPTVNEHSTKPPACGCCSSRKGEAI